jgi:thiol-disulfide isomerase/thioredoxin
VPRVARAGVTRRAWATRVRIGVAVLVVTALAGLGLFRPVAEAQRSARIGQLAPEITGGPWINSEPLSLERLRGRVVFVEFWTYGCINCQHVVPQLRGWHDRYHPAGLTLVGVHAPEFLWERPYDRVVAATKEMAIGYPVVQDNDYAIWKRFGIRAWPTGLLIDRKGVLRYQHIGEGAYAETESMIQRLLAEGG